jgi:hypothetical protein
MLSSFYPGTFDKRNLTPIYERIYAKYKDALPENIMFFEPSQFPDVAGVFSGFVFNLGFDKPPGEEIGSPYHVLNDHSYCC